MNFNLKNQDSVLMKEKKMMNLKEEIIQLIIQEINKRIFKVIL